MIESVLSSLFTLENLLWINVGLAGGIMVGALPGLTGTMAMALLLPLTYGLASIPGVMLLLGVYCGSIYGGSITAILINTPGTPASAATSLDGYPMAQKGHGLRALHDALSASTIGGLFSCAVLLFAAPPIASFALKFGPAEYFALALFGLTIIASVGGKSQIKGLLMGFVGLLISCIGIDPMDGVSRFTFGINRMEGGIDTIPVLIGLFAITEIMAKARDMNKATGTAVKVEKEKTRFRDVLKYKMVLLKSSILGVFIGAVPGTGAAISSFLAYNEAKRTSKHPEEYGHGSEEAVVASESANNAVTGATLIPLLTLGIPGDTNTAVLLGALTMQGIAAGPPTVHPARGVGLHHYAGPDRRQYLYVPPGPGIHPGLRQHHPRPHQHPGPHSGHAVRDRRLCHRLLRVQRHLYGGRGYLRLLHDQAGHAHDAHGHRPGAGQAVRIQPAPCAHRVQGKLGDVLYLPHQPVLYSSVAVYAVLPLY